MGAATVALTLATAAPASAHDGLTTSSPESGATVTAELPSIDLTFSDDFLQLGGYTPAFAIQVSGPGGRFYNTDCVALDGANMSTAVALGESGDYTVVWQVVSSDAHPTSDTFSFSYIKPDGVTASVGSAIGQTCADDPAAEVNQTPTPTAVPEAEKPPTSESTDDAAAVDTADQGVAGIVIPVAFALVVLGAIGTVVGLRLRRRGRQ